MRPGLYGALISIAREYRIQDIIVKGVLTICYHGCGIGLFNMYD